MAPTNDWHSIIAAKSNQLPPDAGRQLGEIGFVVMPGPAIQGGCEQLSRAYDHAVATAGPADVHTGRTGSSIRINDFVNRGPEFDAIYIYRPLLAACCQIIGAPFKLSGMRARTLNAGAQQERLHVDVRHRADGWPLVGCIFMVDAFAAENGATRFVPGSHLQSREPVEVMNNPEDDHDEQVLACGPAGSMIIFNASVWHSHGANRSAKPRRSIQAHFVRREAEASPGDHSQRMRPETLQRLGDLAKYVLNVGEVQAETMNQPRIKAQITFLPVSDGGRKALPTDLSDGQYRPHLVVSDPNQRKDLLVNHEGREIYLGVAFVGGPANVLPCQPFVAELALMYWPDVPYDSLVPGATFTICEGPQVVGFGTVQTASR